MEGYEVNFLEPKTIMFSRTSGGVLQMSINGEKAEEAVLYRVFPHSFSHEYISVRNAKSEEIGVIRKLDELDEAAKNEAIQELNLRYLIPLVIKINSVKDEGDLWVMKVGTDRGDMTLVIQYPHDAIVNTKNGGMLITDLENRRCEIRVVGQLDKKSYRELMRMI